VHAAEAELAGLRTLAHDYNNLSARHDEREAARGELEAALAGLRGQVAALTAACSLRDALLRRLADQLAAVATPTRDVLDDLARLQLLADTQPASPRQRSASLDGLDSPRVAPSQPAQRPQSAGTRVSAGRGGQAGGGGPAGCSPRRPSQAAKWSQPGGQYRAVSSYDPAVFSQSGRPQDELPLREGDLVTLTGPPLASGYAPGCVSGRAGLVPTAYLQPLHNSHQPSPCSSPAPAASPRASPHHRPSPAHSPRHSPRPRPSAQAAQPPGPAAPRELRVTEDGGAGAAGGRLLLAWTPPAMDARGLSQGHKVLGYTVWLDGAPLQQVAGAMTSRVGVDLGPGGAMTPRTLAVATLAPAAQSPPATLAWQPGPPATATDLSALLSSAVYKRGQRQTMLALYAYSPAQQSPHDYTALELDFQAGEVVTVYGAARADGFYHGEARGRRGLVPQCFLQPLDARPSQQQPVQPAGSQAVR